jgi:hypothetical protein
VPALGYGSILIEVPRYILIIDNVLFTPRMVLNLASVCRISEKEMDVNFGEVCLIVTRADCKRIATASIDPFVGLYRIDEIGDTISYSASISRFIQPNEENLYTHRASVTMTAAANQNQSSEVLKWY